LRYATCRCRQTGPRYDGYPLSRRDAPLDNLMILLPRSMASPVASYRILESPGLQGLNLIRCSMTGKGRFEPPI
jgi:hypothetical protein